MTKLPKTEKGFTLVELAIVLVIVGLLIAGILKGQELITNSQITSTVQQIEAFGGAVNTFKQTYRGYPGDLSNAVTRLASCDGDPCANSDGNGILGLNVGAAPAADLSDEGGQFFLHLAASNLIAGVDIEADNAVFGEGLPAASIGGGFMVGDARTGEDGFDGTELAAAPHLVLNGAVATAADATGVLSPAQAARIDRTIDDGSPNTGFVVGITTAAACGETAYDEDDASLVCAIAYRLPR